MLDTSSSKRTELLCIPVVREYVSYQQWSNGDEDLSLILCSLRLYGRDGGYAYNIIS